MGLPTAPDAGFRFAMFAVGVCVSVIVVVPDLVASAAEVAVSVTVGGFGSTEGAT